MAATPDEYHARADNGILDKVELIAGPALGMSSSRPS
jgi:hypothetical protein